MQRTRFIAWACGAAFVGMTASALAQQPQQSSGQEGLTFDLGEIQVVGTPEGKEGLAGSVLTHDQMWQFDRNSLDQAVNVVPGVVSTFDSNGRRNESNIFVRGFDRWQVPLMLDGIRIYLPADNRLDFARFLTSDIAAVQIQKGYASVLDGPGAMGGAINLVTRKPTRPVEVEASAEFGGRGASEGWNTYAMFGTRQPKFYLQGSANHADRNFWNLPGGYQPTANSLQPAGRRLSSDSQDSRFNVKAGYTPNANDEYTVDYISQKGEKGAPLNVYTNPPVPANAFWRWPYWDVQNTSFLSRTRVGQASYVKTKLYYNTFANGLDAYDDATYTTQSANGRFRSPYDDHAYGGGAEFGTTLKGVNTLKTSTYYRTDVHKEQQFNRPTNPNPAIATIEPVQEQSLYTWSVAAENTYRAKPTIDIVAGLSYEKYNITKAEEFNATRGLFENPKGGSDSVNWQGALIWRYARNREVHASVSDRSRFPVIFELYSTRFGTATPNPSLGPEKATNVDLGWAGTTGKVRLEMSAFYSDVRDLIQTVVLPDSTTQTQNVGNGHFYGVELSADAPATPQLRVGANYTFINRSIQDALQPALRATGVPNNKAFLYASWQPVRQLTITPTLDLAGDRWSDMVTAPALAFPYIRTGGYTLLNLSASYRITRQLEIVGGFKNLADDYYELAWGFPQPGRTYYLKTRVGL